MCMPGYRTGAADVAWSAPLSSQPACLALRRRPTRVDHIALFSGPALRAGPPSVLASSGRRNRLGCPASTRAWLLAVAYVAGHDTRRNARAHTQGLDAHGARLPFTICHKRWKLSLAKLPPFE
jgi:hypothetical protein